MCVGVRVAVLVRPRCDACFSLRGGGVALGGFGGVAVSDDALDGGRVGEEGVGLGAAELEDAVVVAVGRLRVVVGVLEVFGDGAGVGFVGVGVLAGVVVATSGAGV